LDFLVGHEQQGLSRSGESFATRAEVCSVLALLLARHGRRFPAREWALRSAENLIAHGYHKDMPLNEALEVARTVIPAGERSPAGVAEESLQWLKLLAPAIVHVLEFTDGDEVHHLPVELGEALAEADPSLHHVLRYRDWLIDEERYTEAEKVLVIFVSKADLSIPRNLALAETAISPGARKAMAERAARGDILARRIAQGISAVYGDLATESDEDVTPASIGGEAPPSKSLNPSEFPPERLAAFLQELPDGGGILSREHIKEWTVFWRTRAKPEALFKALRELRDAGRGFDSYDELFELQRQIEGSAPAYLTLVEGFRREHGWTHYWSDADRAKWLREQVIRYYREKEKQFLMDTLGGDVAQDGHVLGLGYMSWVRLTEYFIECGELRMARRLASQAVASACELVSPLAVPVPVWAAQSAH
jgi:hypothetical protein